MESGFACVSSVWERCYEEWIWRSGVADRTRRLFAAFRLITNKHW